MGRLVSFRLGLTTPSLVTVIPQTDRPKSVRNRCVIEVFGCDFVLSIVFRIFYGYRGIVIEMIQISFFLSFLKFNYIRISHVTGTIIVSLYS